MLKIYKSSAGSGKTYTLVQEYLLLALAQPKAYRQILAVTFTNKATEEMKSRILEALRNLSSGDSKADALAEYLMKESKIKSRELLEESATALLRNLLSDYTRFSVSTIEKFFQRVLRGVARELDIPIGYDVMLDTAALRELAVARTIALVDQDKELAKYLVAYASDKLNEGRTFRLEKELIDFSENIFKEKFWEVWEALEGNLPKKENISEFVAATRKQTQQIKSHMNDLIDEAERIMDRFGVSVEDFSYKSTGPAGVFHSLRIKLKNNNFEKIEFGSRALAAIADPEKWVTKTKGGPSQARQAVDAGLQRILTELYNFWEINESQVILSQILIANIHLLGLVTNIEEELIHFRQDQQTLVISDANRLLQQLIRASEVPFLYEKIGNRYQHYLIDEFQDTSTGQWHNFLPLVEQSLGTGGQSLIVGDAKQSIYRWRNGNPELLLNQVENDLGHQEIGIKPLNTNWRSAVNIVKFNNSLFEHLGKGGDDTLQTPSLITQAYSSPGQEIAKLDYQGYVEIRQFAKGDNSASTYSEDEADDNQDDSWREQALTYTLKTIRDLKVENFLESDICILVRTNREGILIAEYLRKNGISVFSADSILLKNHPPVILLSGMLKAMLTPTDRINQAEVSRASAQINQADDTDIKYQHPYFKENEHFHAAYQQLLAEMNTLLREPLPLMVMQLIRILKLNESDPYLVGFVELVQSFSNDKQEGLAAFVHYWEEKKVKLPLVSTEQQNAVQILTIHRSKGLEFKVVLVPMASWKENQGGDFLWTSQHEHGQENFPFPLIAKKKKSLEKTVLRDIYMKELELERLESMNMAYVAFTRACDRLYIGLPVEKGNIQGKLNQAFEQMSLVQLPPEPMMLAKIEGGFAFGEKEPRRSPKEEKATLTPSTLPDVPFAPNVRAYKIRRRGLFRSNDPGARRASIDRGTLIHEILAQCITHKDLDAAIRRQVRMGRLAENEGMEMAAEVENCWKQPVINDWFSGNWMVRNEADILIPEGGMMRPDRVMTDAAGKEAVVVDYKTGSRQKTHHAQVAAYCQLLNDMGYTRVSGYLLYLEDYALEKVVG